MGKPVLSSVRNNVGAIYVDPTYHERLLIQKTLGEITEEAIYHGFLPPEGDFTEEQITKLEEVIQRRILNNMPDMIFDVLQETMGEPKTVKGRFYPLVLYTSRPRQLQIPGRPRGSGGLDDYG